MGKKNKPAGNDAAATAAAPMPAIFQTAEALDKLNRRNIPQLVKHADVPPGGTVSGEIVKVVDSPVTTIKGKLLWLRHESGAELCFPVTGPIRSALAPGVEGEDKVTAALEKEIGKVFFAKRAAADSGKISFDVYTKGK